AHGEATPQVVKIAVAEGISGSPDVGLAEVWRAQAFEGLTTQGNDGRAQPKLAESWSVSSDGLEWTVTLKRGAVWHDGKPFDAASAAEAISRGLGNRQLTGLHPGLHDVESIRPDGHTLRVALRVPSAFLVDDLYFRLQRPGANQIAIGTGPYIPT